MSKITDKYIQELSKKWLNGTITEMEKQEYDQWYSSFKDDEVYGLTEKDMEFLKDKVYKSIVKKEDLKKEKVEEKVDLARKTKRKSIVIMLAASISLFILSGSYLYFSNQVSKDSEKLLYVSIEPGKDKATLSLENGIVYDLDSLNAGEILQNNGVRIEKSEKGELIYSLIDTKCIDSKQALINTVATPRGGQYKLRLPDSSLVWLNAASSLKFPTIFAEDSRIVELSGEAYFEVSKDQNRPFKVLTGKETVEVLGTRFNVNSYDNEVTSMTTLVEGKVKVSIPDTESKILHPGQQISVHQKKGIKVYNVNIQEAVAWKNGEFMFNNEDIKSAMRKVSRWYDVEFVYETNVENVPIWGSISRYENIQEVLKIIELTEAAHFRIEGRRIYVMK